MLSRRSFLRWSAGAAATALAATPRETPAAPPAIDRPILMNHLGFRPKATKRFLLADAAAEFTVIDPASGAICFAGKTTHRAGDFGPFTAGDFTSFTTPGTYQLRCGGVTSALFAIGTDVYLDLGRNMLRYFQKQRCGDSGTGYHSPCHLDDGIRDDNGQRLNVTGGWHDACDVRKWVSATIYGMIGLARVLQLDAQHQLDRAAFLDELRWGNRYFLAMQEPAGYVMDWCGGDTGNHFTDNRLNTADDRRIRTAACEQPAQYQFILAQALAAEAFRSTMPEAADRCLAAARRCLSWCEGQRRDRAMTHAAAVSAMLALYRTTSDQRLLPMIDKHLALLIELQAIGTAKQPGGYFFRDSSRAEPLRDISDGNLPLIALSEAVLAFPDHPDAARRRAALRKHVDHLAEMSRRGAFDTIPFGLYAKVDPGGDRRYGDAWYRWFMKPGHDQQNDDWWVGINAHLASNAVGLMLASQALGDASLTALAQRQFDWILGSNPFDCSTVTGAGRNQPALFRTSEFTPNTPLLVGGVMNGIGGTPMDTPLLASGNYNTCEYWTPMVGYFGWLGALLQVI